MRKFFIAFLLFLVLAFIATLVHYFYGENLCGVCNSDAKQEQIVPENTQKTPQKLTDFTITDVNGKTAFKFPSNFVVNTIDGSIGIPESMLGFKDSIFNYLNKHQGKELLISAKYLNDEGEPRGYDRANFLKNLLVKEANINPARIIPKAVLSDYSYDKDGKYIGGVSMLFRDSSDKTKDAVAKSITNKTLYAEFGATDFKPDRKLKAYVFELKNYLNNNPTQKVSITGHTDNVGKVASNYRFGLKRANNVMNYMISSGIDAKKCKCFSKGETAPVASNNTKEGRAKNRRITISVQ